MKIPITLLMTLVVALLQVSVGSLTRGQEVIEGEAGEDTIEVVYRIPAPEVVLLPDGYTAVNLGGEVFQKMSGPAGSPVLPVRSVKVLLPPDREVREVEVIPGERVAVAGTHLVEFARSPRPISAPPLETDDDEADSAIYDSDQPYPGRLGSEHSVQHLRGYPILTMLLYPVEYIPAEGKLFYYESLTLRVKHGPPVKTLREERETTMPRRGLPADREAVIGVVDNPGSLGLFD